MTSYYDHAGITIYHGDCREILPLLCADALITDPPYGIGFDYGNGRHDDSEAEYGDIIARLELAEGRLSAGSYVVVWQSAARWRLWTTRFPRAERVLALPKRFVQIYPNVPWWATDYALLWRTPGGEKAKFEPWMPKPNRDWFLSEVPNFGYGRPSIEHPCPRPYDQVAYLVGCFTRPDSKVMDPFMGSGTTLRAAKDLGRRAIGIEIEEKYCEIAAKRLSQEVLEFA